MPVGIKNTMAALVSNATRPIVFLPIAIGKHGCGECRRTLA